MEVAAILVSLVDLVLGCLIWLRISAKRLPLYVAVPFLSFSPMAFATTRGNESLGLVLAVLCGLVLGGILLTTMRAR
jgi:hypothetical protein